MAAAVLVPYQFVAQGVDSVDRAFVKTEKAAERAAQTQAREAAKAGKATEAAAAKMAKEVERNAARQAASAAKTSKAEVDAAKKTAAAATSAREKVFQIRARYDAQEQRAAERKAAAEARSQERALKHVQGIRSRYLAQQQRDQDKLAAKQQKESSKGFSTFGRSVVGGIGGAAMTAGALGFGTVGAAARQEFALGGEARRIAVMGGRKGGSFADAGAIAGELHGVAAGTPGAKSDELAAGMKTFVQLTGDLPAARAHLQTLATAMQSMGTDAEGTARIMVALKQSFGISGVGEMQEAMAGLEAQARASGMPMEALEGHIMNLAAAGARFGLTGAGGAKQIGGLMSMARQGIGDPEKAEKGASHFMDKLIEEAPKLAAMGITSVDKTGKVKDINQVVAQLITKVGGSNMKLKQVELGKLLGTGERGGLGVIGKPLATYRETFLNTQGSDADKTKAATAAMNDEIAKLTNSTATWADTEANAAEMQKASGAQLDAAWETVRAKVGSDLVPALAALVPAVTGATGILDPLIEATATLAAAFKETHDQLVEWGLIKAKPEDTMGNFHKAEKKLADFEEGHQGLWAKEGETEQRAKLQGDVETARGKAYTSPKKLLGQGTDEDFARQWAMASGAEGGAYMRQKEAGMRLAAQIHADPHIDLRNPLLGPKMMNEEQEKLLGGRKEQETADQSARSIDASKTVAQINAAGDAHDRAAQAADRLATSLDKAGDAAERSQPLSDRN